MSTLTVLFCYLSYLCHTTLLALFGLCLGIFCGLRDLQRHRNLCQVPSVRQGTEYKGARECDTPSRVVKIKMVWECGSVQCFFGMHEALGLIPAPPKPGVHL